MATKDLEEIILTPEQKIAKDAYVRYVEIGFDFDSIAREFGVDAVTAEFLVRAHQRFMAEHSIDPTAGEKFDETLAKFTQE